jgi:hypothetical protein
MFDPGSVSTTTPTIPSVNLLSGMLRAGGG